MLVGSSADHPTLKSLAKLSMTMSFFDESKITAEKDPADLNMVAENRGDRK